MQSPATPIARHLDQTGLAPARGLKLMYVIAAAVDVIGEHHKRYAAGSPADLRRSSLGDVFAMCERHQMQAYVVSTHPEAQVVRTGRFVLEHCPKAPAAGGLQHYRGDVAHAMYLTRRARELGVEVALVESGALSYFVMSLLKLAGLKVVPIIHHALWAAGHPPRRPLRRLVRWADRRFFRHAADAVICVSAQSAAQVRQEAGATPLPVHQMRLQLDRSDFEAIVDPPAHGERPFGILYTGRIEGYKGIFDMVEMIDAVERRHPGAARWYILGDGSDREALAAALEARGLAHRVELPGFVSGAALRSYYARSHIAIVPTRSECGEGMAMAAVEAVISGRPVVTSSVVPALDLLRPACEEARVDDVSSYVAAIERLLTNRFNYEARRSACAGLGEEFFDRRRGTASTIERALGLPVGAEAPATARTQPAAPAQVA